MLQGGKVMVVCRTHVWVLEVIAKTLRLEASGTQKFTVYCV